MRFVIAVAALSLLLFSSTARAQPQIPSTFFGTASIDGKAPQPEADVRALIDGIDCTQEGTARRLVVDGGVGLYVVTVVHESQKPGCGREGKTVTFTIAGRTAGQSAKWVAGPQQLDLNAGSGVTVPLPPATATPTGRVVVVTPSASAGTPAPPGTSGTPPIDPITLTPGSGGVRPIDGATGEIGGAATPPAERLPGSGGDAGVVLPVVVALGVVAIAGAVGGLVLSRRRGERNGQR